jgi:hypothetical protein
VGAVQLRVIDVELLTTAERLVGALKTEQAAKALEENATGATTVNRDARSE